MTFETVKRPELPHRKTTEALWQALVATTTGRGGAVRIETQPEAPSRVTWRIRDMARRHGYIAHVATEAGGLAVVVWLEKREEGRR